MKLPGVVAAVAVVVVVVVTGSLASIFSYADAHILPHLLTLTLAHTHAVIHRLYQHLHFPHSLRLIITVKSFYCQKVKSKIFQLEMLLNIAKMTACARERDSQPPVWGSWCVVTDEAAAATAAATLTEAETKAAAAFETMTKTDGNMREQENSIRILQFTYELHTNAYRRKHKDTLTCLCTHTHTHKHSLPFAVTGLFWRTKSATLLRLLSNIRIEYFIRY